MVRVSFNSVAILKICQFGGKIHAHSQDFLSIFFHIPQFFNNDFPYCKVLPCSKVYM